MESSAILSMSPSFDKLIKTRFVLLNVFWFAMLSSLIMPPVVLLLNPHFLADAASKTDEFSIYFYLVSAALVVVSVSLRTFLSSEPVLERQLRKEVSAESLAMDPQTRKVDEAKLIEIKNLNEFERKLLALMTQYFVFFLLVLIINESITLLGSALAVIEGNIGLLFPFLITSILLNLSIFPSSDKLLVKTRKFQGMF